MATALKYSIAVASLLILSLVASTAGQSNKECRTSHCSIYALGCPEPWVMTKREPCFASEVPSGKKKGLQTLGGDDFWKRMYKYTCCKPAANDDEWLEECIAAGRC